MKTSFQSLALLSGCVLFAFFVVKGVDGLALTSTWYLDETCQTSSLYIAREFGSYSLATTTGTTTSREVALEEFNECIGADSGTGKITVCDPTTGEYGVNTYPDDTCSTEASSMGAASPTCLADSSTECTDDRLCTWIPECTDDEPSVISPNNFNYVSTEYNDADCDDPTGNTVIISKVGSEQGSCTQDEDSRFGNAQCLSNGSSIWQWFSPEDDTCSGDVWAETYIPTGYTLCSRTRVGDLYYSLGSCTMDPATLQLDERSGTPSPAAVSTNETPGPVAGVTSDLSESDTSAPSSSDLSESDTLAPSSSDRAVEVTMAPTASDGSRPTETTPAPTSAEETGTTGGAVGVGNGVTMGMGVTLAVGVMVAGMVQSL